jgi:hypothetical protein
LNHPLNRPPPVPAENDNGELAAVEVLPIGNTIAGGEQHVKTGFLGNSNVLSTLAPQELSIREGGPAFLPCRSDGMPGEKAPYRNRRSLIKQCAFNSCAKDARLLGKNRRFEATGRKVEYSFHLVTRQPIVQLNELVNGEAIFQIFEHR